MSDRQPQSPARRHEIDEAAAHWVARRDTGLSAAEERELHVWLAAGEDHRRAFARFETAWTSLDRPAQFGQVETVLADLAGLERRRRRRLAAAGCAAAALLAAVSFWRFSGSPTRPSAGNPPLTAVVLLPQRQTLADQSIVELRDGAAIAADFTPGERRLVLHGGEAHFQVAKDHRRPFVVEANGVEICAVGTAFSVNLDGGSVEVIVTEGTVAVGKPGEPLLPQAAVPASAAGALALLAPSSTLVGAGQRAVVEKNPGGSGNLKVSPVSPSEMRQRLAWRAPRIDFTSAALSDAVALLNRYADPVRGKHLVIADPGIAGTQISGLFRVDDADAFVGILEGGFGVVAERHGDREILLRKAP